MKVTIRVLAIAVVTASVQVGAADPGAPDAVVTEVAAAAASAEAETEKIPEYMKMRAPDSPAFTILGVSPNDVQRPTAVSQLAVSLGSFISNGSVAVPNSLAVEFAPYWLASHPNLTLDAYENDAWGKVYRNFTVSAGTLSTDATDTAAAFTDLAVGVRTKILDGRPSSKCAKELDALQTKAAEFAASLIPPEEVSKEIAALHPIGTPEFDAAMTEWTKKEANNRIPLERFSEACISGTTARTGLLIDVAGALAWRFPTPEFSSGKLNESAAWITAAYAGKTVSFILLGRFVGTNLADSSDYAADAGGRVLLARDRYALSTEGVYRIGGVKDDQYKLTINAEYNVATDTWLSFSYGRDGLRDPNGALVAVANVKWGFGQPTVKREL